jgi:putative oxidoreductase
MDGAFWHQGDTAAVGLLAVRLVLGLGMAAHGAQKLFGWFGGYGIAGTGGFFETIGFRPGRLFAALAGLGEFAGGLLVALGLLGPIGPALVVVTMVVAMPAVHRGHGFFAANNGSELPLAYAAGIGVFAFTGFGAYALDAWLAAAGRWTPETGGIAVILALVAGYLIPLLKRKPAVAPAAS